jgi:hypothetical protein
MQLSDMFPIGMRLADGTADQGALTGVVRKYDFFEVLEGERFRAFLIRESFDTEDMDDG